MADAELTETNDAESQPSARSLRSWYRSDQGSMVRLVAMLGAGISLVLALQNLDAMYQSAKSSADIPVWVALMAKIIAQMALAAVAAVFVVFLFGTKKDEVLKMTALALVAGLSHDVVIHHSRLWLTTYFGGQQGAKDTSSNVVALANEIGHLSAADIAEAITPNTPITWGSPQAPAIALSTDLNTAIEKYWVYRDLVPPVQQVQLDTEVSAAVKDLPAQIRENLPALRSTRVPGEVYRMIEP